MRFLVSEVPLQPLSCRGEDEGLGRAYLGPRGERAGPPRDEEPDRLHDAGARNLSGCIASRGNL
jgi:hypothetical protein